MTLTDHVRDLGLAAGLPFVECDFVEDAENLAGVVPWGQRAEVVTELAA
jgi:hypothetical protein